MDDENTAISPVSNTPEVSPQADEPTQPAIQTDEAIQPAANADEESAVAADIAPPVATNTRKREDFHDIPHPHFKWNVEVRVDGHDVYQGYVKDISMKGVHLFLDHNLQNAKFVKLHIYIPPLVVTDPHHVLEVTGKIASTVYDSVDDSFRSGINFLEFTLESDRAYLQSRLSEH